MRRVLVVIAGITCAWLATPRSLLSAGTAEGATIAESVTIHVRSVRAGEPVEFAVRYLGEGLKPGAASEHLKTPYDLTIPGSEAHALFRQTGGSGVMQVEVTLESGASGSTAGVIALAVAANGRIAVTGFEH